MFLKGLHPDFLIYYWSVRAKQGLEESIIQYFI